MKRRVLYICTTFPRLSETFVEREVGHLRQSLPLEVHSLWKGGRHPSIPVRGRRLRELLRLFLAVPLWLFRRPGALAGLIETILRHPPRSLLSLQETGLGLGFGILLATDARRDRPAWIHAIWATAPATAAWTAHRLAGLPFSFGAHAYDLFQRGGDPLLGVKIREAAWIRTTTSAAREELLLRGADSARIVLIRRGLALPAEIVQPRPPSPPLRIISIGRLVEKKGYALQLDLYERMAREGIPFEAVIVGEGPQRSLLEERIRAGGLAARVRLAGALPHAEAVRELRRSDLLVFTGTVSRDGDRDGLPNVVPEAMAHGIPVATRPAAGVLEAVEDGATGIALPGDDPGDWCQRIGRLWEDTAARRRIAANARAWVENHFQTERNAALLAEKIRASATPAP